MFWVVYILVFCGLLYLSLRNFPKHPVMSILVTICMMLAFTPLFTKYNVYEPIVLGFPLWFLAWFLIAAIFVWIFLLYTVTKLLPGNKELESIWETVAKQTKKPE